jgi:4-aminobutyrate aminotransferase-like enzyme/Ser/Thr protein kinase RdoA (MazF antagonist)
VRNGTLLSVQCPDTGCCRLSTVMDTSQAPQSAGGTDKPTFAAAETQPPDVSLDQAVVVARTVFGVTGSIGESIAELGSQQDRNFRIDGADGRYVLKIANPAVPEIQLAGQNAAMEHLTRAGMVVPRPCPALSGATLERARIGDFDLAVRLLTYLDGTPLASFGYLAPAVRGRLGGLAAMACRAFADFDAPGLDRRLEWDLRQAESVVASFAPHVADPARRERVVAVSAAACERLARVENELRIGPIHGDVTGDNVVGEIGPDGRPWPSGLIDFGDMSRSWVVAELAVTCAALLHQIGGDPLGWLPAVAAFDAIVPLDEADVAALWPLVVLRGATLAAADEKQLSLDPRNDYVAGNLEHDWVIFESAASVPWALAEAAIRDAVSLRRDDRPAAGPRFAPVVPGLAEDRVEVVDLSATTPGLDDGRWLDPGAEDALFADAGRVAAAALARYGEHRLTRAAVHRADEPATCALHTEVDLAAGRAVAAPAAGVVAESSPDRLVIVCDAATIRLEGVEASVNAGDRLAGGDPIGVVAAGEAPGRGRIRVQLCVVAGVDPPGFATPSAAKAWRRICPDPSPLLGIDCAAPETDAGRVFARRDGVFARVQPHYYADPPQIERGWRHHLVDATGRVYLDMVNNVTVIGHAHPRVAQAIARQSRLLNTNSRFNYAAVADFSERLAALVPAGLDTVLLVNSGTEANDLALRLAWAHTGRAVVVAMREAYHGWSMAADAISTSIADNPRALETRPEWVRLVPSPNPYSGIHRGPESGPSYIRDALAVIQALGETGEAPAAFISETVHGNAGGILLPRGYLEAVYGAVRAAGGVCIADEIQVGYGRLGHHFWGFREQGVEPDVITVAKATGNGHPLGAVITRREIAESFAGEGSFFSSTGGNPVSCRVGLAVLDVLETEGLQENARDVGEHLLARLRDLAGRHPLIGAVHGIGLYASVELVRDRETREPATEAAEAICERMRECGIIVQPTGDHLNMLKIKPPLCITRESADFFVEQLELVLRTGW